MPPPPSLQVAVEPDRFVRELTEAHVLDATRAASVVATFEASGARGGSQALGSELVRAGLLTQFQADRAANGEAARLLLGPYVLQESIGSGSFGTVYRAIRRSDGKTYAVKVLPLRSLWNVHLAKKQVQIFAGLPPHRSVVPFVDIDSAGVSHYLVWPFVQGETLDHRIGRVGGALPPAEAVRIMAEVADGLALCHQKGIVHGLLKPGNILIGSDDQPKILDLGIGAILTENLADGESMLDTISTTATMVSMIDCAAPETLMQPTNRTATGDAYGFGCILYYLLTGKVPFPDGTVVHKMIAHQTQEPMQVRARNPNVPPALARLTEQLLVKNPEQRPRNMASVRESLLQSLPDPSKRPVASASPEVVRVPMPPSAMISGRPTGTTASSPTDPPSGPAPASSYDGSDESIDFDVAMSAPKPAAAKRNGEAGRESPRAGIHPKPEPPAPPSPAFPAPPSPAFRPPGISTGTPAAGPAPLPIPPEAPVSRLRPMYGAGGKSNPGAPLPSRPAPPPPPPPPPSPPEEDPFPEPVPLVVPPPQLSTPRRGGSFSNRSSPLLPPNPTSPSSDWTDEGSVPPQPSPLEFTPREYTPRESSPPTREYISVPAPVPLPPFSGSGASSLPPPRPPGFPSVPSPPSFYSVPVPNYPQPAPPGSQPNVGFGPSVFPNTPASPGPARQGLTPVALGFGAQRRGTTPPMVGHPPVGVPSSPGLPVQQYLEMPLTPGGPSLPRVTSPSNSKLVLQRFLWRAVRVVGFWLPMRDIVQVTIFGPTEWVPGETTRLYVYVHERTSEAGLRTMARTFRTEATLLGTGYVDQLVKRGVTLGLHLSVVGGRIGRSLTGIVWDGSPVPVEYEVFLPPVGPGGLSRATLSMGLDGVKAGEVPFPILIANRS